jgi:TonB family protein
MRPDSRGILTLTLGLLISGNSVAEWRCDCTRIVGSCAGTATAGESFIEVKSSVGECSRVDYFVDGIPFVALVVGGTERQDWIAGSASPAIIVSSCEVCLDKTGANSEPAAGSSIVSDGEPTRLIGVTPDYPPAAAAAGIEGHVDVRFTLSPTGTVVAPEVVSAEPAGIFDAAALAAVSRWRYTHPSGEAPPVITERVPFVLTDELFSLTASNASETLPGEQDVTGRNRCIRENSRYDFGTTIDVSLVNACAEPLVVYNCSAGTGAYSERWVCTEPEQSLAEASRLEITRAPNSEYWWLACKVDDATCRDQGADWVRAMHRQLANVDPQDRTRLRLGRSY